MRILIVDDDRMICDGTAHRIVNMRFLMLFAVCFSTDTILQ